MLKLLLLSADDRRQLCEELRLHPEAPERDEPPETGGERRRPAQALPNAAPPQLCEEDPSADRQDLLPAGRSRGGGPRHAPLTAQAHNSAHTEFQSVFVSESDANHSDRVEITETWRMKTNV